MKWLLIGALLSLSIGCGRDPGERMGRKYQELVELVRKDRGRSELAVTQAKAWLKKSEKELAGICDDRERLAKSDQDAAQKAVTAHGRHHREAQKELDQLIEGWDPVHRLAISALMVDLSQVCMPDAEKITPFR